MKMLKIKLMQIKTKYKDINTNYYNILTADRKKNQLLKDH